MKDPFIIYANLESLLEKTNTFHCLHTVHLIQQKISLIIIEVKIL